MGDVAIPWLKRLVYGLSLCRPGFNLRPVLVGCMVDKVALGQVFAEYLLFSPVIVILPTFHTHSVIDAL